MFSDENSLTREPFVYLGKILNNGFQTQMKIMIRRNSTKIKGDMSVSSLLRNIKSGVEMLSHIEWVSANGSHLLTVGVMGAVGLFLALRDGRLGILSNLLLVSDKDTSSERLRLVPGLRNLGNNCFLNVVLQSLSSCSSFRRYLDEIKELQVVSNGVQVEDFPLLMSLAALLEELGTLQDRNRSLNPGKVMSAMQDYIPQFQLANEQDAEEALFHLLSCLKEELADSFMPNYGSLANADAPTNRIFAIKTVNSTDELKRWRQRYLGPFDGVLSSFLACRTCSSEILMDSGFFRSLPLSLMFTTGSSVLGRLTLEDCIESFLSPELLEDYHCSHCWHIAAIKYLTLIEGKQVDMSKLRCCVEQDHCDCKNLSSLQSLPWLNRFSRIFKQLYIACFPQILCIQLQRSSMNAIGELVKIQGHIHFPLILDLSSLAKYEFGVQKRNMNESKDPGEHLCPSSISNSCTPDTCLYPTVKIDDDALQTPSQQSSPRIEICSDNRCLPTEIDKVAYDSVPSKSLLYRLISVVEHFGRAGSGHYTVYRGVRAQIEDADGRSDLLPLQWFCISDSHVHRASEEDVLGAEASLLFYERI